ncbi:MAG: discoidin domain-containing protein [Verrucomicrobia bacterium]|nr:discoidin domain-containing protein [Verrucomicrobiota bacterium]MCH8527421.1 discoidin domain-containing protein [Kiritimatiellia bacterium]
MKSTRNISLTLLIILCAGLRPFAQQIPEESRIARLPPGTGLVLINPLDDTRSTDRGRHNIQQIDSFVETGIPARLGTRMLRLRSLSTGRNGKASYWLPADTSSRFDVFGFWIYLEDNHRVNQLGIEVTDGEGEMLLAMKEVGTLSGWHWVEFVPEDFRSSFNQPQHSGALVQPLRRIGITWFAPEGENTFLVDGLVGRAPGQGGEFNLEIQTPHYFLHDDPVRAAVTLNNPTSEPRTVEISYKIQRDSHMVPTPPPHPDWGTDIAHGRPNQTWHDGNLLDEGSLTDGIDHTYAETPWGQGSKGAMQQIDLESVQEIKAITLVPADGNWLRLLNVSTSTDGETFTPVANLQNIDLQGLRHERLLKPETPVSARHLHFEHHDQGQGVQKITLPSLIRVFDGVENETWQAPETGEVVAEGSLRFEAAPGRFALGELITSSSPGPGAYLFSYTVNDGERTYGSWRHLFVRTAPVETLPKYGRFGLNVNSDINVRWFREMGFSWIRYENHKWNFVSPEEGKYFFDGSVAPWRVPFDRHYQSFIDNELQILPYLFQSPRWISSAEDPGHRRAAQHPPKDLSRFGEFVFQSVARYGSVVHPEEVLKTNDKKTGLNKIQVYSLWNEPNLDHPHYGHFIGPLTDYFEMFRYGAIAAKQADPSVRVATAGFAGIDLDLIDQLASYTYANGRTPVDYADVLNAHHYTARQPPETARVNTNIQRGRDVVEGPTFEERVLRLDHWRRRNMPGKEMWMTETGYDTGGHESVSYREQASRIPRLLMIALGSGFDQVHLYRSSGSTPRKYEATGIFDDQWNPKPSAFSFATLIQELDGYDLGVRIPHPNENVWAYGWKTGDDVVIAAWVLGESTQLGFDLGSATVTDSFGHRATRKVTADFQISDFPVYIRDISNRAEAQRLFEAGLAARRDLYARRERMAQAPGFGFDFGKGERIGAFDLGTVRRYRAILGRESFSPEQGYGFEGNLERITASERAWIRDDAARDELRLPQDTAFVFNAPGGRMALDLSANDRARFRITSGESVQEIDFEGGGDYRRVILNIGDTPVRVTALGHTSSLRWLRVFPEPYSDHVN